MVQKIHPQGVIWVPSSRLMWADHQKKLTTVPSIYKEVHDLGGTGIGQPTMGPAGGFVTGNGGLDSSGLMATPIDEPAMSTNPCKFHFI